MSGLSAILATLFLGKPPRGRLPVLSAYSLTNALLESVKEEIGGRNFLMTKFSRKNVPDARIDLRAS